MLEYNEIWDGLSFKPQDTNKVIRLVKKFPLYQESHGSDYNPYTIFHKVGGFSAKLITTANRKSGELKWGDMYVPELMFDLLQKEIVKQIIEENWNPENLLALLADSENGWQRRIHTTGNCIFNERQLSLGRTKKDELEAVIKAAEAGYQRVDF